MAVNKIPAPNPIAPPASSAPKRSPTPDPTDKQEIKMSPTPE